MAGNPIDGIRPIEPKPSLVTSSRPLAQRDGTPIPYGPTLDEFGIPTRPGWQQGVTFRDSALNASGRWPYSPGAHHDDKVAAVQAGVPVFMPFTIYVPVSCDELTYARDDELMAEATDSLLTATPWELAREFWTGETVNDVVPDNPSLQLPFPGSIFPSANIGAAAVDPVVAIGNLLQAYEDGTRSGGATIHVPAVVMPYVLSERAATLQGDIYVGPCGSIIVPGPGYPAAGATGPKTVASPNGMTAAANQAWMFVSGPVERAFGDVTIRPEDKAMRFYDPRTNLYRIWAERQAIYRFDPSAVWAQLITVPQTGI